MDGSGDDVVSDVTLSLTAAAAVSCKDDVPPSPLVNSINIVASRENGHDNGFRRINPGTPPSTALAMLPRQAAYVD